MVPRVVFHRHFHVIEQVSYDGVASLHLSGHETTAADAACTPRKVATR